MSLLRGWTICDRCGFKYRRYQLSKEATKLVVCSSCNDRGYDLIRHPQNRPFRPRRELLPIPDGRPQDLPPTEVVGLEDGGYLLTEAGEILVISAPVWDINRTIYIAR